MIYYIPQLADCKSRNRLRPEFDIAAQNESAWSCKPAVLPVKVESTSMKFFPAPSFCRPVRSMKIAPPPLRRFRLLLQKAPGLPTGTYPGHSVSLFDSCLFCARRRVRPATLPEFPTAAPPRGSPPVPPHIPLWRAPILPRRGLVRSPGAFSVRRPWLHAGFRYRGYSECGNTRHNSCRATDIFQFRFRRRPGAVSAFSGRKHADGTESEDVQC